MDGNYSLEYIDQQIVHWQHLKDELLLQREQKIQQGTSFIECKDCKTTFEFSESDKLCFAQRGWDNPIRCKPCRKKRKQDREKYDGLHATMNNTDKMRSRSKPRSNASKMYDGYRM